MLNRVLSAVYLITLFGLTSVVSAANDSPDLAPEQIVHNYIAAFNARDTQAMLDLVTDDVQWLSIDGEKISVETNSKKALEEVMQEYFKSCTSCRSKLAKIFSSDSRVSALEIASWETSSGRQEQQSMSLYEFSNSLIKRVYYFPSEK